MVITIATDNQKKFAKTDAANLSSGIYPKMPTSKLTQITDIDVQTGIQIKTSFQPILVIR